MLDALARGKIPAAGRFNEWQVAPVSGGANNRLFRARGPAGDLAIKFTLRDPRQRAQRENAALQAVREAGLGIAPEPILLDTSHYSLPLSVQEWLPGTFSSLPPQDEAGWTALLDHYLTIHSITPENSTVRLRRAVLNFASAGQGVQTLARMADRLPPAAQPEDLRDLIGQLHDTRFPSWKTPGLALCRADPAPLNFIRRPERWASVDWENSGWGDPAFEIADLLAHPAYLEIPRERNEWIIDNYSRQAGDPHAELRIRTDCRILQVFWVVRLARYLYEIPLGLDERLADRPPGWEADIRAKYEGYVEKAEAALE